MENKDRVRDKITSPQKPGESYQDELHRQRLKRQLHQARVCSKKQTLGHIPRVAPSEQDLDTGSASQAGQTIQNSSAVAGVQRASKKGAEIWMSGTISDLVWYSNGITTYLSRSFGNTLSLTQVLSPTKL